MNAAQALCLARDNGILIGVSGADLILHAEREPTPDVLEALRHHKAGIVALLASDNDAWTADDCRAFFDERAGIAEFDGGQTRDVAESIAFECCVVEWLDRYPARSDPDRCAWCQEPDRDGHTVVPFGTETHDHTWLHSGCWHDWFEHRRQAATEAMVRMGIVPAAHPSRKTD